MFDETPAALEAEVAATMAGAPPEPDPAAGPGAGAAPVPAGPSPEDVLAGYKLICGELVDLGATSLVPAWRITPAESGKLAGAMAQAMLLWFPDMVIPPKYLALLTVAGVAFEIAQARRDASGRYLPTRLPEKPTGENNAQTAAH